MTCPLWNLLKLMAIFILLQDMITDITAVNVALNKGAKDCNDKELFKITDGDKDPTRYDILTDECLDQKSHIIINLGSVYEIHYVVVYASEETQPGQLDYFAVEISSSGKDYIECSNFWGPSVISDEGMRVNCKSIHAMFAFVKIKSMKSEGLSISEVEVHTLASGNPGEGILNFRGCFKNLDNDFDTKMDALVPEHCRSFCMNFEYLIIGIKNKIDCLCGTVYNENDELPFDSCNLLCDDGVTNCGGSDAISVYTGTIRLPTYKGCVTMKLGLESHMQGTMTVAKCLQHCRDYNHAALRNGNDCFCTNEYLTVAQKYDECTVKCSGNPNEICGGEEYMSLYESLLIKNILRCAGSYDMYGLCVGGCKEGFQGDYCIERVLQKDDKKEDPQVTCDEPNPCTNQPYTECFIDNNIIKCVCIAGYSRKNEFSECEVLQKDGKKEDPQVTCDEPNPCTNQPYTECFIHNNIIKCVCIVGYSRRNAFSECEDFDECAFKPCDAESAVCINTNGSYICECLPGFNRMNLTEVCIANVSVGNEPKVIGFKYWTTLAYLGPLLSVLFLFFIVCFYASPQKTESFDEPPIATKKKKVSNASTTTAN